jgi:hypothetical protein
LRPVDLDERSDPLEQLARDPPFHECPVVVHPRTLPNPPLGTVCFRLPRAPSEADRTDGNQGPSNLSASDCPGLHLKQTGRWVQAGVTVMASGPRRPTPMV